MGECRFEYEVCVVHKEKGGVISFPALPALCSVGRAELEARLREMEAECAMVRKTAEKAIAISFVDEPLGDRIEAMRDNLRLALSSDAGRAILADHDCLVEQMQRWKTLLQRVSDALGADGMCPHLACEIDTALDQVKETR